jgi:DNA-binding transcriptional LysR family regulator
VPNAVPDLQLFRYALASAEHGSFRRAAAALNVQQSTVSRGVRSLEHRVGAELFERGHAGIRPTAAGDRFLQEAILGFDHLDRAMQRVEALQRGEHGELTVGVSVPFALLGDSLGRFREKYGGIYVEIVECTTSESWPLVQQRKVDIAFVAKSPPNGAQQYLHLRDESMFVVLPKLHPLAGAGRVVLEELRDERFILSAGGLGPDIRDHLALRLAKPGVEPNIQVHRVGQCNLVNMVARGFGVTIVAGQHAATDSDGVAWISLAGRNVISLCAVWMETNPNPALKGLLNIVRKSRGRRDPATQHPAGGL